VAFQYPFAVIALNLTGLHHALAGWSPTGFSSRVVILAVLSDCSR
jgi:hypothetical protein